MSPVLVKLTSLKPGSSTIVDSAEPSAAAASSGMVPSTPNRMLPSMSIRSDWNASEPPAQAPVAFARHGRYRVE